MIPDMSCKKIDYIKYNKLFVFFVYLKNMLFLLITNYLLIKYNHLFLITGTQAGSCNLTNLTMCFGKLV